MLGSHLLATNLATRTRALPVIMRCRRFWETYVFLGELPQLLRGVLLQQLSRNFERFRFHDDVDQPRLLLVQLQQLFLLTLHSPGVVPIEGPLDAINSGKRARFFLRTVNINKNSEVSIALITDAKLKT